MTLVVSLTVEDGPTVEIIAIRRTAGDDLDDSVNAYEVRRFDTSNNGVRQMRDKVEVLHRYGDGAAVLARKALEATT